MFTLVCVIEKKDCENEIFNMIILQRGKFFPQLTNLVRINTPKAVQTESRKAFRKLPNVEQAISTLTNLKGVGTTLASGLRKTKNIYSVFYSINVARIFSLFIFLLAWKYSIIIFPNNHHHIFLFLLKKFNLNCPFAVFSCLKN